MKEFIIGDKVTVFCGGTPIKIRKIKRALKRFYELNDGSKWDTKWGHPYPSTRYPTCSIVPWELEHSDAIQTENLRTTMKYAKWDEVALDTLIKINELMEEQC